MMQSFPRYSEGLSPRVRGNHDLVVVGQEAGGPIPASAGEPGLGLNAGTPPGAYPRECGGTSAALSSGLANRGLSPRVRGNRGLRHRLGRGIGPIPASAGEPPYRNPDPDAARAYPRECGGTGRTKIGPGALQGLSPRVRGNRAVHPAEHRLRGPIPASAGEPGAARAPPGRGRAYPRECGGTAPGSFTAAIRAGLSPRVRGNREQQAAGLRGHGLSPRVRGNPGIVPQPAGREGPIPASAGEPTAVRHAQT